MRWRMASSTAANSRSFAWKRTVAWLATAAPVATPRRPVSRRQLSGGVDVESDIGRVLRVREAGGDGVEIRFDANQGYTAVAAIRFARETQRARVAFLEQPTPAREPLLLGRVRAAGLVPVMAD